MGHLKGRDGPTSINSSKLSFLVFPTVFRPSGRRVYVYVSTQPDAEKPLGHTSTLYFGVSKEFCSVFYDLACVSSGCFNMIWLFGGRSVWVIFKWFQPLATPRNVHPWSIFFLILGVLDKLWAIPCLAVDFILTGWFCNSSSMIKEIIGSYLLMMQMILF